MRVLVVIPPAPVVSLADARAHLRVDGSDEDALIETLVAAATAHIDGPAGWLGRAVGVQVLEARGALFAAAAFRLRYPPVLDVMSVEYERAAGGFVTLDPARYDLHGDLVGSAWGTAWPAVRSYRGAAETVRVQYRAGYSEVPAPIRVAILMMTDDLYRNRGNTPAVGGAAAALLAPFRVFR